MSEQQSTSAAPAPVYNNPTPVAVAMIPVFRMHDGVREYGLVGIVRGIVGEESFGKVAMPGGFVDEYEQPRAAASRETDEETSLQIDEKEWAIFDAVTTPSNRMLTFFVRKTIADWEEIRPQLKINPKMAKEVIGFQFIAIDTKLAFPLHEQAAREYLASIG